MILNIQELSLFVNYQYPYEDFKKFYENMNFFIHLFLLCLAILIMTFYGDVTTPIFFWAFELGIFINHYSLFYTSYRFYFSFFILYTATIVYYFVSKIRKSCYKEKEEINKDEDFDIKENYKIQKNKKILVYEN